MKRIQTIIDSGLCLGCGLCEAIAGRKKCEMAISSNGFYRPQFKQNINKSEAEQILNCCPAVHVEGNYHRGVWGNVLSITESWSLDPILRKKSATGGLISSLAIYLLEAKKVDAILQVGLKDKSWLFNELRVSRTKEDIFRNAQSRYAPALVFDKIRVLLDSTNEVYGFIGKPCDIAGIKNFIQTFPEYKDRIRYTLAIFCAGMPSYNATKTLISQAKVNEEPSFLKYRGNGWPGEFETRWENGKSYTVSYNDSWGKVLGKTLEIRCKVCPDGIGMLADISTGDSWNTKNGYPDFTEADGRNFCFIRTEKGNAIYQEAKSGGYIANEELEIANLKSIHKYQFSRRIFAGWRITAIQILTHGLLKFKGLGLFRLMLKANPLKGARELIGTIKRF